jgi:ATP-dependent RNA helicase RhlE
MHFKDLNLIEPLLRAITAEGYDTPTPIQEQAIPYVLDGRDMIGCAQTGTGKTAAFALPILQLLSKTPAQSQRRVIRALILSPTRELASQIAESFAAYGRHTGLRAAVVFGGVGQTPQVDMLKRGIDILVATPGRLLDLMNQGYVRLNSLEIFVLDEADRMLDMGFIHDVRRVLKVLPPRRQNLLFSATMPKDIQDLADSFLHNPAKVEVTPQATTVEKIAQSVYFVSKQDKRPLLEDLLRDRAIRRVLIFTRTKHGANKLAKQLTDGGVRADAIHGNKSQSARERALSDFKSGNIRALVATDIAARGIDVEDVTHVINYELPNEPESYVHRIGRTARAGAEGIAISFCDSEERAYLRDIERIIRLRVPVVSDHPYVANANSTRPMPDDRPPRPVRGGGRGDSSRSSSSSSSGRSASSNGRGASSSSSASSHGRGGTQGASSSSSAGRSSSSSSSSSHGRGQSSSSSAPTSSSGALPPRSVGRPGTSLAQPAPSKPTSGGTYEAPSALSLMASAEMGGGDDAPRRRRRRRRRGGGGGNNQG